MLTGRRKGFGALEAVYASFVAALLLAVGAAMLAAAAQIVYRYEQRVALESAKREVRAMLDASSGLHTQEFFTSSGFRVSLLQSAGTYKKWRLSKQGMQYEIEGVLFVSPR